MFHTGNYYGLHNSFTNFNTNDINDIINKIDSINISKDEFLSFFNTELNKFKIIDDNSDINMFQYFIDNYKTKHLVHDPFHPTNLFFYEMFRQIVLKLTKHELKYEDSQFINLLNPCFIPFRYKYNYIRKTYTPYIKPHATKNANSVKTG